VNFRDRTQIGGERNQYQDTVDYSTNKTAIGNNAHISKLTP